MKVSTLWSKIGYIYDKYDFSSKKLVNDILIISRDNYYLCCFGGTLLLRLEVDFKITKMITSYKAIIIEPKDMKHEEFTDIIPDKYIKIITPFLRDFQIDTILE